MSPANKNMSSDHLAPPMEIIPHRPPFLLLDQVLECSDHFIVGTYRFANDNPIFNGHFPQQPIVPGVLLLEGAAQTLAYWALQNHPHHLVLLTGTDQAKWTHPVYPEQEIRYQVTILRAKLGLVVAEVNVQTNHRSVFSAKIKGYLKSSPLES